MTVLQKTIKNEISCVGVGLHSGAKVKLTLKPAAIDAGITFKRTDISGEAATIAAHYDNVVDTRLCTCIGDGKGHNISTIEHLMSALHGLGITNLNIEITGEEMPILDGSSADFVFLLHCAGIVEQQALAKMIRVKKPVTAKDGDAFITLLPARDSFGIDFTLDYSHCPTIGKDNMAFSLSSTAYEDEIAFARTFGLSKEIEQIRNMGLAKGGSLKNVLIATDEGIMNPEGLRIKGEFVRHKVLDAIGDMYLAGYGIEGQIIASKSGHRLNNLLLKELFKDKTNYEIVNSTLENNPALAKEWTESLAVGS